MFSIAEMFGKRSYVVNDGMTNPLQIVLDNPAAKYVWGDAVRGVVKLQIERPKFIKSKSTDFFLRTQKLHLKPKRSFGMFELCIACWHVLHAQLAVWRHMCLHCSETRLTVTYVYNWITSKTSNFFTVPSSLSVTKRFLRFLYFILHPMVFTFFVQIQLLFTFLEQLSNIGKYGRRDLFEKIDWENWGYERDLILYLFGTTIAMLTMSEC